ncbi:hypothetical protein THASP1DRAFT_29344 [Thamnocephalis sphaerospora]|uniref:Uncharacterized protein n=1 Tax=Thamnocephalis sphaerospora TaxID=78915 RepID=A0A4V1IWV3_9FUNG|nr:hypothetical protein THASP1DRAFT_29344 [Thamnocephalis sphaerospora]|eukprot:RKP08859.1 hypothetical protein THASP1DRAFT_29344 [Thamnocephalis sphaerospora]
MSPLRRLRSLFGSAKKERATKTPYDRQGSGSAKGKEAAESINADDGITADFWRLAQAQQTRSGTSTPRVHADSDTEMGRAGAAGRVSPKRVYDLDQDTHLDSAPLNVDAFDTPNSSRVTSADIADARLDGGVTNGDLFSALERAAQADHLLDEDDAALAMHSVLPFRASRASPAPHSTASLRSSLFNAPSDAPPNAILASFFAEKGGQALNAVEVEGCLRLMEKSVGGSTPNLFAYSTNRLSTPERARSPMRRFTPARKMADKTPLSRTVSFPEHPIGSSVEGTTTPKRRRHNYFGAGYRMDSNPYCGSPRFEATFGRNSLSSIAAFSAPKRPQDGDDAAETSSNTDKPETDMSSAPSSVTAEELADAAPPTASLTAQAMMSIIEDMKPPEQPVPLAVTPYDVVSLPPKMSPAVRQHRERTAAQAQQVAKPPSPVKSMDARAFLAETAPEDVQKRLGLKTNKSVTPAAADSTASSEKTETADEASKPTATPSAFSFAKPSSPPSTATANAASSTAFGASLSKSASSTAALEKSAENAMKPALGAFATASSTGSLSAHTMVSQPSGAFSFGTHKPEAKSSARVAACPASARATAAQIPDDDLPSFTFAPADASATACAGPAVERARAVQTARLPVYHFGGTETIDTTPAASVDLQQAAERVRQLPEAKLVEFTFTMPTIPGQTRDAAQKAQQLPEARLPKYLFGSA